MSKKSPRSSKKQSSRSQVSEDNLFNLLVSSALVGNGNEFQDRSPELGKATQIVAGALNWSALLRQEVTIVDLAWDYSKRFEAENTKELREEFRKLAGGREVDWDALFNNTMFMGIWAGVFVGVVAGRKLSSLMECEVGR